MLSSQSCAYVIRIGEGRPEESEKDMVELPEGRPEESEKDMVELPESEHEVLVVDSAASLSMKDWIRIFSRDLDYCKKLFCLRIPPG